MPITIHNHVIDKLAIIAGFGSGMALYPQLYLILKSGTLEGVSVVMFLIIFCNSLVWLAYSIHRGLFSLGVSAILNILASGSVILLAGSALFS